MPIDLIKLLPLLCSSVVDSCAPQLDEQQNEDLQLRVQFEGNVNAQREGSALIHAPIVPISHGTSFSGAEVHTGARCAGDQGSGVCPCRVLSLRGARGLPGRTAEPKGQRTAHGHAFLRITGAPGQSLSAPGSPHEPGGARALGPFQVFASLCRQQVGPVWRPRAEDTPQNPPSRAFIQGAVG
ncbi:hypothetical protein AAFF_G00107990 [Aldrovandia affinis]|uniref:Uncharacterized protein n=1 Tax=Aldrovandia affinis TaxID=143900 RepID=A0AAD7WBE8_9TELE|nr:hypothetical protein AAFF_G00107990 [Aldrovandia affinis]